MPNASMQKAELKQEITVQKRMRNMLHHLKSSPDGSKIGEKSVEFTSWELRAVFVAQVACKMALERFPGQPGKFDFSILRITWLILVPFLTPLDLQGGPKIDHF